MSTVFIDGDDFYDLDMLELSDEELEVMAGEVEALLASEEGEEHIT